MNFGYDHTSHTDINSVTVQQTRIHKITIASFHWIKVRDDAKLRLLLNNATFHWKIVRDDA